MERLTEHWNDKYIRIKGCSSLYPKQERKGANASNAVARLAAYEDTGLEPEEIKDILERYRGFRAAISDETGQPMVSWTRASKLVRADKEGRVVVLEDVTVHQANTIMGMCERLNAMKSRRGDDQEPLITWQLYNALLKSIVRTEAETAIGGGGDG